jgi:hypothetical protein
MARFRITSNRPDEDIAGKSTDLVGQLVALRPEGTVTVKTEYGPTEVSRARVLNLDEGTHMGLYLIFWDSVKAELADVAADPETDWLVGVPTVKPQAKDPSRTFYEIQVPEGFDPDNAEDVINMFERTGNVG